MLVMNLQSFFLVLSFCIVVLSKSVATQKPGSAYSKKYLSKSSKNKFNVKNIKNIITFGDSYTSSWIKDYETMETVRDSTTSSGPNWVFYLSDILNATSTKNNIKIYNFAAGGASVTSEISPVYAPEVNTFTKQVRELFKPKMVDIKDKFPWTSKDSLFGVWFGINDTGNRKSTDDLTNEDYEAMTFLIYFRLLDELYQAGARNFVILNIPDLEYAPLVVSTGGQPFWMEKIASFNKLLPQYIKDFHKSHKDTNIFLYDAFNESKYIRDNYTKLGIEEVDGICPDIWNPDETCLPKEKYYWANDLHPCITVHKALTEDLYKFMKN